MSENGIAYVFRGFYYIPPRMMAPLRRYIDERIEPGSFLFAVLCNNLAEAVAQADDENLANLPAYIGFLHNEVPSICWGTKERVGAWLAGRAVTE